MPPTGRTRVLLVDDAVVARLLLSEALLADPDLELAGTAADGRAALDLVDQVHPDVVVLDVEMPVMDGLATLRELRARHRTLPVIMFSTLTSAGERATLDALTAGANDYVTKPSTANRQDSVRVLREQLLPKIKALCPRGADGPSRAVPAPRRDAVPAWSPPTS